MTTLLHLPFNDDSGISGLVLDQSQNRFLLPNIFSRPVLSTDQVKFGNTSCYFNGGAGFNLPPSGAFVFGTGDFTIEFWAYMLPGGGGVYARGVWFGNNWDSNDSWGIQLKDVANPGKATITSYKMGQARLCVTTSNMPINQWFHIAATRESGVFRLFFNGVLEATNTSNIGTAIEVSSENTCSIGSSTTVSGANEFFSGYLDDLRISKTALYTSNFTPPGAIAYTPVAVGGAVLAQDVTYSTYEDGPVVFGVEEGTLNAIDDIYFGGTGKIVGTVKITPNTPAVRKVRLHRKRDGIMVGETWSAPNASYSFTRVDISEKYYAVGFDHTGAYQGVIADNLVPEAM